MDLGSQFKESDGIELRITEQREQVLLGLKLQPNPRFDDQPVGLPQPPYLVLSIEPLDDREVKIKIKDGMELKLPLDKFCPKSTFAACLSAAAGKTANAAGFTTAFEKTQAMLEREKADTNATCSKEDDRAVYYDTTNFQEPSRPINAYATDGEDSTDEATDADKIEQRHLGLKEINIDLLDEPDKLHRVRAVNKGRVKEIIHTLLEKKNLTLTSNLTVVERYQGENLRYTVVDGNHRLNAMKHIRDEAGQTQRFRTVFCRVYRDLSSTEALCLGFNRNREAVNVLKMTHYETVANLRKVIKQIGSQASDEYILKKIYSLLNITTRAERQSLQPHLHVTKMSSRCYTIIKTGLADGQFKSTTFNCLRNMEEKDVYKYLTNFRDTGFKKASLKQSTESKKTAKRQVEVPLTLIFAHDGVQVKKGSSQVAGSSVTVFGVTVSAAAFGKAVRESLASIIRQTDSSESDDGEHDSEKRGEERKREAVGKRPAPTDGPDNVKKVAKSGNPKKTAAVFPEKPAASPKKPAAKQPKRANIVVQEVASRTPSNLVSLKGESLLSVQTGDLQKGIIAVIRKNRIQTKQYGWATTASFVKIEWVTQQASGAWKPRVGRGANTQEECFGQSKGLGWAWFYAPWADGAAYQLL